MRPVLFFLVFVAALAAEPVRAGDTIRWGGADNPPFHIFSGPGADTGYSDIVRIFFADRLTEYDHQKVKMTLARLMENARNGENYCYCNLRRTPEREALFYYSDVTAVTLGPRLYVRKGSPILDMAEHGTVSLEALLDSGRYAGVAETGRSFGPDVRRVFEKHKSSVLLQVCPDVAQKFEMVHNNRVDFFIEYPFVLQHYVKTAGRKQDLVPLGIAEHDPYVLSYVVCTKTDFGKRVIERINEELRAVKGTPAHRELFATPARDLDENSRREYGELYGKFLKMN
jgi:uncharacterized protein (TIGR02285 family)